MTGEYFVILNTQSGGITPMTATVNGEDELAVYDTREDAIAAAEYQVMAQAFGFEVFRRGDGEHVG